VVGSAVDVDSRGMLVTEGLFGRPPDSSSHHSKSAEQPRLTMLVLDYKSTETNRNLVLRTQKPRLLVSLDFLLAVADFFIPSFHASGGTAQSAEYDPIGMQGNIRIGVAEYVQEVSDVWLSPEHQLEVDAAHVSEFVYDGKGGSLFLLMEEGGRVVAGLPPTPLILIGNGKRLRFKNVHIKGGVHLDACIHLGADSSYTASPEDGCVIEDAVEGGALEQQGAKGEEEKVLDRSSSSNAQGVNHPSLGIGLDFQAVGLELTFYDATKWPVGSVLRPEKLLRARMDFSCGFHSQGEDQQTTAALKGMRLEGGSGLTVVDPFDVQVDYSKESGKQDFILVVSSITVRMTGNILRLLQRLQEDLVTTFHLGGDQVATRCTQFDRVWSSETSSIPGQQVAFWRPRVPPGYAIVGDCATSGVAPPSQSVLALSMAYERIKRPIAYELVWSSHGVLEEGSALKEGKESQPTSEAVARECRLWLPVAPAGYVAVGCIAWKGKSPPPLSLAACIRMDLLTSSSFSDCIFYSNPQPT
jgi:vacuolar protein sorting-associated protein 13A/C